MIISNTTTSTASTAATTITTTDNNNNNNNNNNLAWQAYEVLSNETTRKQYDTFGDLDDPEASTDRLLLVLRLLFIILP